MLGHSITGKAVFIGIVQCAVFAVENTKEKEKGKRYSEVHKLSFYLESDGNSNTVYKNSQRKLDTGKLLKATVH